MTKKNSLLSVAFAALTGVIGLTAAPVAAHAQTSSAAPPPPAPAPTVTTRWNGAPETREEDRRFRVTGRIMYDLAYADADCSTSTCTNGANPYVNESGFRSYARRAFLGAEGRLTEQWRYNVKLDFALGGSIRADDLYLEYAGQDWSVLAGSNNAVAAMEDRNSSLNIPFNERSFIVTAAGWGKRPGVAFVANGGNWSLGAALQSNDPLDTSDTASNGAEAYFAAFRGTWAPIYQQTPEGTTVLHLGASARFRDFGDGAGNALNGLLTYAPGALANKSSNNATVGGAESDVWLGVEAAFQWNAFGAEAEYGRIQSQDSPLTSAQLGDADANGYYVDLFWSPTGESRSYRAADGSWGAVRPLRTLGSDGGIGHIMVSGRYENLDLTDANFGNNGSELTAYTLGLTWVPIEHIKFQLNYSSTDIDYANNTADGDSGLGGVQPRVDNTIDAVTLRTQFDW